MPLFRQDRDYRGMAEETLVKEAYTAHLLLTSSL